MRRCNVCSLPVYQLILLYSDSFKFLLRCICTCAGTFGAKEKPQESSSGAQSHLPLTAVTKSSSETSAAAKADLSPTSALNPSVPDSPTTKRGEYPFRRGKYNIYDETVMSICTRVHLR